MNCCTSGCDWRSSKRCHVSQRPPGEVGIAYRCPGSRQRPMSCLSFTMIGSSTDSTIRSSSATSSGRQVFGVRTSCVRLNSCNDHLSFALSRLSSGGSSVRKTVCSASSLRITLSRLLKQAGIRTSPSRPTSRRAADHSLSVSSQAASARAPTAYRDASPGQWLQRSATSVATTSMPALPSARMT